MKTLLGELAPGVDRGNWRQRIDQILAARETNRGPRIDQNSNQSKTTTKWPKSK